MMTKQKLHRFNIKNSFASIYSIISLAFQSQPVFVLSIILLEIVQGLLPLALAWLTKTLFDLISIRPQGGTETYILQPLISLLLMYAALSLIGQFCSPLNDYLARGLTRRLLLTLQTKIYTKINGLAGLAYFENPQFYDTLRIAGQNIHHIPLKVLSVFATLLRSVTTFLGFLGILISLNPFLTGAICLVTMFQVWVQFKMNLQRLNLSLNNSPKERKISYYGQILSGTHFVKEVQLFNTADYFLNKFTEIRQMVDRSQERQQLHEMRWQLLLNVLFVAISSGAYSWILIQAFRGFLSLGDIALYTSAATSVQLGLSSIVSGIASLNESTLFYEHFTKLMRLPPLLHVAPKPIAVPPLKTGIEFRNVSFRYMDQQPWILHSVNLFIPAGKCLALVGSNGSGKSTLTKLLTRLYEPTEGCILWEGIDIREFDIKDLWQHIGVVLQDFVRYELTAQQNIGIGCIEEIDDLFLTRQASVKADIHNVINSFPRGYQTVLSRFLADQNEQGVNLSGGEWQKVALARMFMRDADLLVLDEPTSNLDVKAEYEIFTRFGSLMKGRTSLLISHRFSTVHMADTIAVLENGQIAEYGSHTELLSAGGTYSKLYELSSFHGHSHVS